MSAPDRVLILQTRDYGDGRKDFQAFCERCAHYVSTTRSSVWTDKRSARRAAAQHAESHAATDVRISQWLQRAGFVVLETLQHAQPNTEEQP